MNLEMKWIEADGVNVMEKDTNNGPLIDLWPPRRGEGGGKEDKFISQLVVTLIVSKWPSIRS